MSTIDLSKYGITDIKEIVHNPSYEVLFAEETKPELEGFERGQITELDTVNVMTGIYTGRSPKDKFFVKNEASEDSVWWTSEEYKNDNKPCSEEAWNDLKAKAVKPCHTCHKAIKYHHVPCFVRYNCNCKKCYKRNRPYYK